ncbi:hypothetical protein Ate02nite_31190 [Paractinoplanes tereljensis]|uniref:Uncharacterized protein n=1 Tax=Paractinoplanes tereljensis TaxID=571912 RepID=A0A919TSM3_9ACTN|nr:hypothetical protein Ate02nite_31190 [Actinoplanes tereljensis]
MALMALTRVSAEIVVAASAAFADGAPRNVAVTATIAAIATRRGLKWIFMTRRWPGSMGNRWAADGRQSVT